MTDAEIIKALECCCDTREFVCTDRCPLYNCDCDCWSVLKHDVLNLINRQRAEIEISEAIHKKALEEIRDLHGTIYHQEEIIETQKAEIEKLTNHILDVTKMMKAKNNELEAATAKIERLKKGWTADIIETNNIKAEAIKEFAERLKDRVFNPNNKFDWFLDDVDSLVKEMVGDAE